MARGARHAVRCRVPSDFGIFLCRVPAAAERRPGSSRRRPSPPPLGAARLYALCDRRVRSLRRLAGRLEPASADPGCDPLRRRLGIQICSLCAGACRAAARDQPFAPGAVVGIARLRCRLARLGQPRIFDRAPSPAGSLRLDPGGVVVGDRDSDDDRLRRHRAANRARPHSGGRRHGLRHSGAGSVGRHSRHRLCRGDAPLSLFAHLEHRRPRAVFPKGRRLDHRRGRVAAAAAELSRRQRHRSPRRARRLHVLYRFGRGRDRARPRAVAARTGRFFWRDRALDRRAAHRHGGRRRSLHAAAARHRRVPRADGPPPRPDACHSRRRQPASRRRPAAAYRRHACLATRLLATRWKPPAPTLRYRSDTRWTKRFISISGT